MPRPLVDLRTLARGQVLLTNVASVVFGGAGAAFVALVVAAFLPARPSTAD